MLTPESLSLASLVRLLRQRPQSRRLQRLTLVLALQVANTTVEADCWMDHDCEHNIGLGLQLNLLDNS